MKLIAMNIFHVVFLLIFVILVSSSNATLSTNNQTSGPPSGNDETSETQGEIREETDDSKKLSNDVQESAPTPSSSTPSKNDEIPADVLKFFNDPEMPEEEYLDSKTSYEKLDKDDPDSLTPESDKRGQIPFKEVFEEYQKYVPFVVQREKYKDFDTIYYPASHLTVTHILDENDASKYETIDPVKKIIDGKEIKYDFGNSKYYDWWFTSSQEKRLIPACPHTKEVIKEFPSGKIIKSPTTDPEKERNILNVQSLEPDELSSDDEIEDPTLDQTPASETSMNVQSLEPREFSSDDKIEDPPLNQTPASETFSTASKDESPQPDPSISTPTNSRRAKGTLPGSNSSNNKQTFSSIINSSINLLKNVNSQVSILHSSGKPSQSNVSRMGNTFQGRILKARKIFKEKEYMASNYLCEYELKPTFVKEEDFITDAYYAGYMVEFKKKVTPLHVNFLQLAKNMLWFHVAHLMRDRDTKDTIAIFNYSHLYEYVKKMKKIPIYTDYTVNKYSHATVKEYEEFYSIENQRKIFEGIKNHEKYFDEEKSLFFVKQELMDQKSVPTMAYKRVALDYMNIAPMYKIIKDNAWRKVENVVLKLPMVTDSSIVMFVTGVYGKLKINGKVIHLDDGSKSTDEKKTKKIRVPYAFYKVIHVTYDASTNKKLLLEHQKFFFNIVIVTHNNPFETKPKKICEMPVHCERIGWTKVVQKDPALGFTYCCAFTKEFAEKLGIDPLYKGIDNAPLDEVNLGLLDLRVLWYVEENKSTRQLGRKEFPLIRKEPYNAYVYEKVQVS